MNCEDAKTEFSALLDGELTPDRRATVERHLSQCSDCLRDLDGLKRVDTLYRRLSPQAAPDGFDERVRRAVRPGVFSLARRRLERRFVWPALAAAAGLVVVVGLVFLRPGPLSDRTQIAKAPSEAPPAMAATRVERERPTEEALDQSLSVGTNGQSASDAAKDVERRNAVAMQTEAGRTMERLPAAPSPAREPVAAAPKPEAPPVAAGLPAAAPTEAKEAKTTQEAAGVFEMGQADAAGAGRGASAGRLKTSQTVAQNLDQPADAAQAPPVAEAKPVALEATGASKPSSAVRAEPPSEIGAFFAKASPAGEAARAVTTPPPASLAQTPTPTPPSTPPAPAPPEMAKKEADKAPESPPLPVPRKWVADRAFDFRDGVWYQEGYAAEETTALARGSDALAKLLAAHPDVGGVGEIGDCVVFRIEKTWFKILPKPGS